MSCALLSAFNPVFPCVPNHDQLDDLESFYYVLHELMFSWSGPGSRSDTRPSLLDDWEYNTNSRRLNAKRVLYVDGLPTHLLLPFWLPASVELLESLFDVAHSLVRAKRRVSNLTSSTGRDGYKALLAKADEYYERFLSLFDKAIEDLKGQEAEGTICDPPYAPAVSRRSPSAHDSTADDGDCSGSKPDDAVAQMPPAPIDETLNRDAALVVESLPRSIPPSSPSVAAHPAAIAAPTRILRERKPKPTLTTKLPPTKKRSRPREFEEDPPAEKRTRSSKKNTTSPPAIRIHGWVRTEPHRTRAWVKAHPLQ